MLSYLRKTIQDKNAYVVVMVVILAVVRTLGVKVSFAAARAQRV